MDRKSRLLVAAVAAVGTTLAVGRASEAVQVRVVIENLAPTNGGLLTPVWVGFHDGSFDTYDTGSPASVPLGGDTLERLAEDGNTGPISDAFAASPGTGIDATVFGPGGAIAPGESAQMTFSLDGSDVQNHFFSYVSMVIPSNDAFIANGDPLAHAIFDASGAFLGADFLVLGSAVNDAGTEDNTELPLHTAAFGQVTPNTGDTTVGGVVMGHPGFMDVGSGGILDDPGFANADFTVSGYRVARITVTKVVPEPTTAVLGLAGLSGLGLVRRRRA